MMHLSRYLSTIATTAPLNATWIAEYEPGNTVQTDPDWQIYASRTASRFYCPVSSCKMGVGEMGVVSEGVSGGGVEGCGR